MIDPAVLLAEITNDPAQLGYAPFRAALQDQQITDLLNDPTKGGTRPRREIAVKNATSMLHLGDLLAMQPAQASLLLGYFTMVAAGGTLVFVDPLTGEDTALKTGLLEVLPAGTPSGDALRAGLDEPVSRAVKLFGQLVSNSDVAEALASDPARQPREATVEEIERRMLQDKADAVPPTITDEERARLAVLTALVAQQESGGG